MENFQKGMQQFQKNFTQIQKTYLPNKPLKNIIEYYYNVFKITDDYIDKRELKRESKKSSRLLEITLSQMTKQNQTNCFLNQPNQDEEDLDNCLNDEDADLDDLDHLSDEKVSNNKMSNNFFCISCQKHKSLSSFTTRFLLASLSAKKSDNNLPVNNSKQKSLGHSASASTLSTTFSSSNPNTTNITTLPSSSLSSSNNSNINSLIYDQNKIIIDDSIKLVLSNENSTRNNLFSNNKSSLFQLNSSNNTNSINNNNSNFNNMHKINENICNSCWIYWKKYGSYKYNLNDPYLSQSNFIVYLNFI
jgi:hypothetical protein